MNTVPTNTSVPLCPHCAWPIHGQHHVDEAGVSWHLGCWEKQEKAAAEANGDTAPELRAFKDFWEETEG